MPAKLPQISATATSQLQALGVTIRGQRKQLRVSAAIAAESAGMSRTTWHRIEQGNPAVTMGAYLQALSVLGLTLDLQQTGVDKPQVQSNKSGWIPTRIALTDYPQLQQLAWHVRGSEAFNLSPREALDIYERHGRHLDSAAMSEEERELLVGLRTVLGNGNGV